MRTYGRMARWAGIGLAVSALLAGCLPAGQVDAAYGGGGGAATPCPVVDDSLPWASASGRFGGSIVVACPDEDDDYLLVAFDPTGQLDPAFGEGGVARVESGGATSTIAHTTDGALLTVTVPDDGSSSEVRRFLPDGTPDATFGDPATPGALDLGEHLWINAVAPSGTGAVIASLDAIQYCAPSDPSCPPRAGLRVRSVDATGQVGPTAHVSLDHLAGPPAPGEVEARVDIVPLTAAWHDGALVVAGPVVEAGFDASGALVRVPNLGWKAIRVIDGRLDPTYGADGMADLLPHDDVVFPWQATIRAGQVVAVTTEGIVRLDTTGQPDSSFGDDGVVALPTDLTRPTSVALDNRGRLVVGGGSAGRATVLHRFLADGTLDASFGDDGRSEIPAQGAVFAVQVVVPFARILVVVNEARPTEPPDSSVATIFRVGN